MVLKAVIHIYKGHVIHAQFEGLTGEQAFIQIFVEAENRSGTRFLVDNLQLRTLPDTIISIHSSVSQLLHKTAVVLTNQKS